MQLSNELILINKPKINNPLEFLFIGEIVVYNIITTVVTSNSESRRNILSNISTASEDDLFLYKCFNDWKLINSLVVTELLYERYNKNIAINSKKVTFAVEYFTNQDKEEILKNKYDYFNSLIKVFVHSGLINVRTKVILQDFIIYPLNENNSNNINIEKNTLAIKEVFELIFKFNSQAKGKFEENFSRLLSINGIAYDRENKVFSINRNNKFKFNQKYFPFVKILLYWK